MRSLLPLALLVATTFPAHAQKSSGRLALETVPPGYAVARLSPREAHLQIVTRDGRLALLLSDDGLTMQLTDRALREIEQARADDAVRDGQAEFTEVLETAVRGTAFESLRTGYHHPRREIRSIRYEDGRLVITGRTGQQIFGEVRSRGVPAMQAFVPEHAKRFAREFNWVKNHAS
jgi:hypothetical protein